MKKRQMLASRLKNDDRFFVQGALILLPVFLLAGIAFFTLRQDKILIRHEATEKAKAWADEITEKIWMALRNPKDRFFGFEVDAAGTLTFPKPYPATPVPRPADAKALSLFNQARVFADGGDAKSAWKTYQEILQNHTNAMTESGVPLAPLAGLKAMELPDEAAPRETKAELLETVCGLAIYEQPSALTPFILKRVAELEPRFQARSGRKDWVKDWESHERLRRLYSIFKSTRKLTNDEAPPVFWIEESSATNAPTTWLATTHRPGPNLWIACVAPASPREFPEAPVTQTVAPAEYKLAAEYLEATKRLPKYLGATVAVADRPFVSVDSLPRLIPASAGKPASLHWKEQGWSLGPPEKLASAAKVEGSREYVRVNVHLTSPQLLFAQQRTRTFWFSGLVGASALAATFGFFSARRAFLRQQDLAELQTNFVSSVSHELRAPIASVRLMAEGLGSGRIQEQEKQKEYFRFIVQECRRLGAMIENVLDFSRMEQGRKGYELEFTDVGALVNQAVKVLEPAAAEKGVRIEIVTSGEPCPWLMDGRAMQQALVNLLDNAVKHSAPGGLVQAGAAFPEASASPLPQHGAGTELALWVKDDGEGIPVEDHARIFERFYRRGSELRRESQGVGIGLSIVKHIVEAHAGRVVVESGPGQGSRFTIKLPSRRAGMN